MKLTFEQTLASLFDRNSSVTANAGSGKTKVLVDRYVDILSFSSKLNQKHPEKILKCEDPSEIVAITFTKKAASEMKEKINIEINKRINNPDCQNREYLTSIRNKLIYSNVSTIHSFCHKLMKDYPVEAEVVPDFGDLSTVESNELVVSEIRNFIMERTNNPFENDRDLEEMIFFFSKEKIISYLTSLVNDEYGLKKIKKFYDENKEILLETIEKVFVKKYSHQIDSITEDLEIFYLIIETSIGLTPNKIDLLKISKSNFDQLKTIIVEDYDTLKKAVDAISNVKQSGLITNDFVVGKYYKDRIRDTRNPDDYIGKIPDILKIKETIKNHSLDAEVLRYSMLLVDYATEILERVNAEKDKIGKYNFEDLMNKALKVLSDELVIEDLKSKIKYLMIDEFQDTNDLQLEIVKKIITNLTKPTKENSINLFLVGDTKQSIYAFRKADVRVFQKAIELIAQSNSPEITSLNETFISQYSAEKEDFLLTIPKNYFEKIQGKLKLKTTFRLQPILGAFLNLFFKDIMVKEEESDYSVEYEDFVIGRNADKENLLEFGSVNFLIQPIPYKNKQTEQDIKPSDKSEVIQESDIDSSSFDSEINVAETTAISRKIQEIVNTPQETNKYLIQKDGESVIAKYSDIFVLSRKKSTLELLATEFRERKIPYRLHSGAGFYSAPEIRDLIAYLNFISNQNDDVSLLSILKSQFFEFSDNEITLISTIGKKNSYYDKLKQFAFEVSNNQIDISYCDIEKIKDAISFLNESITLAPSMSIQSIIRRLVEKSFYLSKMSINNRFEQINSNIEKIIEYSRDFESSGYRTMYDFIDELNFNLNNDDKEAEAVVITGDNAVNLMTIHSSKGLDAPIVFVIDTNSKVRNFNSDNLLSEKFGFVMKVPNKNEDDSEFVETPMFFLAKQDYLQNLDYEELRLLYVALTRAKDHLFVSASIRMKKENLMPATNGFFDIISESLKINFGYNLPEAIENSLVSNNSAIIHAKTDLELFRDGNNFTKEDFKFDINIEFSSNEPSFTNSDTETLKFKDIKYIFDDIKLMYNDEFISASRIMSFTKDNKNEYFEKYVYSLQEKNFQIKNLMNDNNSKSLVKGNVIHYLFEHIKQWYIDNEIDEIIQRQIIQQKLEIDDEILDNKDIDQIIKESYNTTKTKLIQKYIHNLSSWIQENEFVIPFEADFLKGIIDLIIKNEDGNYEVWDWKSNKVNISGKELKEVIAEKGIEYEPQMRLYTFLISLIYPGQNEYKARLLFTNAAKENAEDDDWTYTFVFSKESIEEYKKITIPKLEEIKKVYI